MWIAFLVLLGLKLTVLPAISNLVLGLFFAGACIGFLIRVIFYAIAAAN